MHAVGPYCDVRAKFMSESNSHDIRRRHCSRARRVRDRWQYITVRIWANGAFEKRALPVALEAYKLASDPRALGKKTVNA